MLVALLLALEIHVLWFQYTYDHKGNPDRTVRVKAVCQLISLILTAVIFVQMSYTWTEWHKAITVPSPAAEFSSDERSEAREIEQLVTALQGPENYLRYLELRKGR